MKIKDCVLLVFATACVFFMIGLTLGTAYSKGGYEKFCPECGGHYSNLCNYCRYDGHELSNANQGGSQ